MTALNFETFLSAILQTLLSAFSSLNLYYFKTDLNQVFFSRRLYGAYISTQMFVKNVGKFLICFSSTFALFFLHLPSQTALLHKLFNLYYCVTESIIYHICRN